ncbi:MAG: hypothetical protein SVM79_09985 [Chloroflexota bacterium]|nr:hypothetical protein [Chloroflexota bacterium]
MEITAVVKGAWDAFATKITVFLPKLMGAIILFVAGLIIAKIVKMAIVKLLKLVRFDAAAQKTGVKEFLSKGSVLKAPSEIIGSLAYWFIMILAIIASFDAMGLPIVSDILNNIFLYIPNVVAAIIVLILGVLFGNLLSASVRTAASNAGLTIAEGLGKASLYAVVIFSSAVALIQLGIGEEIVRSAFGMAFGSLALAFGLAFGIGGKEVAADYLKKWFGGKDPSVQE